MSETIHYENPDLWTEDRFTQKHELLRFEVCSSLVPSETTSILDVGCGNGAFMKFLENQNAPFKLLGLERSEAARQAKVCQSEVRSGSADNLLFGNRAFDLVSALEVIEHLPYGIYEKSLQEIQRVANRTILISVPYRESRRYVQCPYCGCQFNSDYHMRSFDEKKLKCLFSDFHMVSLKQVMMDEYVFAPILRSLYRLVSRNSDFPHTAVCPHCGFAGRNEDNQTFATTSYHLRRQLRDTWKDKLPKYQKPRWFVALYQRIM